MPPRKSAKKSKKVDAPTLENFEEPSAGADEVKQTMIPKMASVESADTGSSKAVRGESPELDGDGSDAESDGPLPSLEDFLPTQVTAAAAKLAPEEIHAPRIKTRDQTDSIRGSKYPNTPEAASGDPKLYKAYIASRLDVKPPSTIEEEMDSLRGEIEGPSHESDGVHVPNQTEILQAVLAQMEELKAKNAKLEKMVLANGGGGGVRTSARRRRSSVSSAEDEPVGALFAKVLGDTAAHVHPADVVTPEKSAPSADSSTLLAIHEIMSKSARGDVKAAVKARAVDYDIAAETKKVAADRRKVHAKLAADSAAAAVDGPPVRRSDKDIEQALLQAQRSHKYRDENVLDLEAKRDALAGEISRLQAQLASLPEVVHENVRDAIKKLLTERNVLNEKIKLVRDDKYLAIARTVAKQKEEEEVQQYRQRQIELESRQRNMEETFEEWLRETLASKVNQRAPDDVKIAHINSTISRIKADPNTLAHFKAEYQKILSRELYKLQQSERRRPTLTSMREIRKAEGPMQLANVTQNFRVFASGVARDRSEDY